MRRSLWRLASPVVKASGDEHALVAVKDCQWGAPGGFVWGQPASVWGWRLGGCGPCPPARVPQEFVLLRDLGGDYNP